MKTAQINPTILASLIVSAFLLSSAQSEATVYQLTCTATRGINRPITQLKRGDILRVSGTCTENVVVPESVNGITIDGVDKATTSIAPTNPNGTTALNIRGREITVKNLTVNTNGQNTGIAVRGSGIATIDNVIVQGAASNGVLVNQHAFGIIVNSTLQNNGNCGISISENSGGRVGFLTNSDVTPSPNTITGNVRGVCVSESSSANIMANVISNNSSDGIFVDAVSFADIGSNTINNNGEHGINFGRNSSIKLGRDTGATFFDLPNATTVNNALFGVRCFINSSSDGVIGTLNGASGATDLNGGGCIDSTIP